MEKNILAYFKSPEEAEGAARKLRALRVVDVGIDRVSKYPEAGTFYAGNPAASGFGSLAALTLGVDAPGSGPGILMSSGVDASGMSDGGLGGPTGRDVLLTAVVDEGVHHQALRVIEQCGGQL